MNEANQTRWSGLAAVQGEPGSSRDETAGHQDHDAAANGWGGCRRRCRPVLWKDTGPAPANPFGFSDSLPRNAPSRPLPTIPSNEARQRRIGRMLAHSALKSLVKGAEELAVPKLCQPKFSNSFNPMSLASRRLFYLAVDSPLIFPRSPAFLRCDILPRIAAGHSSTAHKAPRYENGKETPVRRPIHHRSDHPDRRHAKGLALGGTDEGLSGERGWVPNAYAAYVRDLDGNKIAAYCFSPA